MAIVSVQDKTRTVAKGKNHIPDSSPDTQGQSISTMLRKRLN